MRLWAMRLKNQKQPCFYLLKLKQKLVSCLQIFSVWDFVMCSLMMNFVFYIWSWYFSFCVFVGNEEDISCILSVCAFLLLIKQRTCIIRDSVLNGTKFRIINVYPFISHYISCSLVFNISARFRVEVIFRTPIRDSVFYWLLTEPLGSGRYGDIKVTL